MFLSRHNYVTPWPIVLILVCMRREGPYLPISNKINREFGLESLGGVTTPLVRRVTKKLAWLDEGKHLRDQGIFTSVGGQGEFHFPPIFFK